MENKILIVDGSNLLFQMFFGMPSRIYNEDGIGIWGVIGFVGALLKIVKMTSPTHVAVLFDGESHNPRTDLDSEYKANRPSFEDVSDEGNPFLQLPYIYKALDALHICHAETADCEADDWIASYAIKYGAENSMVISSFDSDLFQLINERVHILRYRGDNSVICDKAWLLQKYGITPEQYADFKALTGDSSDNIKGAEKVGPKTAAALVNEFGTLSQIIENAGRIKKPAVAASIARDADRLIKNLALIKLDGCACLPFELEVMRYTYDGSTTNQVLTRIGLKK
jgi:DNA polymerase-1